MKKLHLVAPTLAIFGVACALGGQGQVKRSSPFHSSLAPRSPGLPVSYRYHSSGVDVITAEELQTIEASDGYAAVRRLRSSWLRPRSVGGSPIALFVDGVRVGDLDMLREVPFNTIRQLTFLAPYRATLRWGTGYTGGAIMVLTRG